MATNSFRQTLTVQEEDPRSLPDPASQLASMSLSLLADTEMIAENFERAGAAAFPLNRTRQFPRMPEFRFSPHSCLRLSERTDMSIEEMLAMLNAGRMIWLNSWRKHWQNRAYLLFYSAQDKAFFIAIVAIEEKRNAGVVVTILTQDQFESDFGPVEYATRKRTVNACAATSAEAIEWALSNPSPQKQVAQERHARHVSEREGIFVVLVDFYVDSGVIVRRQLYRAPGRREATRRNDPNLIVHQHGFLAWFKAQLKRHRIPIDRIVSIKAKCPHQEPADIAEAMLSLPAGVFKPIQASIMRTTPYLSGDSLSDLRALARKGMLFTLHKHAGIIYVERHAVETIAPDLDLDDLISTGRVRTITAAGISAIGIPE